MEFELEIVIRLAAAAVLGAAVGFERESSDQPAGLRTHMTVAVGAALFGIISTTGFEEFVTTQRATNIQFDVTRVASTTVTAVGFLGAGMIFRRGTTVHHLTTAASIWVVAAVGLACGVGDEGPALLATVALLIGLAVLRPVRDLIRRRVRKDSEPVRIDLVVGADETAVLDHLSSLPGIEVKDVSLQKDKGAIVIAATVEARPDVRIGGPLSDIARRSDVQTLQLGGVVGAE